MTTTDRTTEALLARRALAENATPGKWITTGINSVNGGYCNRLIYPDENSHFLVVSMSSISNPKCAEDADHISANSPDVVMADIDEILRLRTELARLEKEADWLAMVLANACSGIPLSEYIEEDVNGMSPPAPEHWREAARKAMEKMNIRRLEP
ncbi:hypothetical protein [Desulfovibrio sp. ZJ369]|uniref:hypothetical protein n=1 Tax=Desulfovibrio sp. ZJ369 TaxID=2709793 RepID=UPI0013ED17A2|nr:hypothetical protein [Desulfovibrio sp. ZJ369]